MSGICDKCKCKPCPAEGEGLRYCDFYIRTERNYEKFFGTPERAARTLADLQTCSLGHDIECTDCEAYPLCESGARNNHDALLEWLRGDSDGE